MEIEILTKVNTPSHSLKKGVTVNMRGADAMKLVNAKKAKLTAGEVKTQANTKKILDARVDARRKAKEALAKGE